MVPPEDNVEIGPIAVRISKVDVEAFVAATDFGQLALDSTTGLPLSYIPTLLGHVQVKPALVEALGELDRAGVAGLIHLRQDVCAFGPLFPERTYRLRISCRRDGSKRVVVTGYLDDPDAGPAAEFEAELMRVSIGDCE